jgi:hypothetical protein
VVRRAEKDNTAGETKDIVEVLLRSLPRREQSLLRVLALHADIGRHHTSSQTSPPKLWHTNMIGRSFYAMSICFDIHGGSYLTVPSLSRYDERDVSRFHAWLAITLCDTTPRQSATYASYPNVSTRAVGSTDGMRVLGQGSVSFWAVHVASRSPVRPWTKTMLVEKHLEMLSGLGGYVLNSAFVWVAEKFDAGGERRSR